MSSLWHINDEYIMRKYTIYIVSYIKQLQYSFVTFVMFHILLVLLLSEHQQTCYIILVKLLGKWMMSVGCWGIKLSILWLKSSIFNNICNTWMVLHELCITFSNHKTYGMTIHKPKDHLLLISDYTSGYVLTFDEREKILNNSNTK